LCALQQFLHLRCERVRFPVAPLDSSSLGVGTASVVLLGANESRFSALEKRTMDYLPMAAYAR
jgi:hypothetical protein